MTEDILVMLPNCKATQDTNRTLFGSSFHDLCHTTASILLSKGWTLKDMQEWLGHSDITITANLYTHVDITRKQSLAKSLAGTLAAPGMKNEQTDTCVGC